MAAGNQLHRLTQRRVQRDRAMMGPVQAHDLSEHMRIPGVALGARGGVSIPIPRHRHRVDREDLVAGRDQRRDPRSTVGLDADLHPRRGRRRIQLGPVLRHEPSDQHVQRRDTARPFGHPPSRQPPPVLVDDLHVMVIFGPVVTDEQHRLPLPASHTDIGSAEETAAI